MNYVGSAANKYPPVQIKRGTVRVCAENTGIIVILEDMGSCQPRAC